MTDRLLTAADVADLLCVPVSWVREQTRNEAIPHVRLGRYVRYDLGAVNAWWRSLACPPRGQAPRHRKHGAVAGL